MGVKMEFSEYSHRQGTTRLFGGQETEDAFTAFESRYGELKLDAALLYFIRRFGFKPPADSYKNIAEYKFKTSIDDDLVVDVIFSSNKPYIYFGLPTKKYRGIIDKNFNIPLQEYYNSFCDWLLENNYILENFESEVLPFFKKSLNTLKKQSTDPKNLKEDGLYQSFKRVKNWKTCVLEYQHYMFGFGSLEYRNKEAYKFFNDWFEPKEKEFQLKTKTKKPTYSNIYNNPDMRKYKKLSAQILREFLKPTYIRDVYYNIHGKLDANIKISNYLSYFDYENRINKRKVKKGEG